MFGQPSYLGVATADWVAALKSSDSLERRLAAHALAEIGRTAREAVPALTEALRDSESFVRVWAAAALARVEPENPNAIPAVPSENSPAWDSHGEAESSHDWSRCSQSCTRSEDRRDWLSTNSNLVDWITGRPASRL